MPRHLLVFQPVVAPSIPGQALRKSPALGREQPMGPHGDGISACKQTCIWQVFAMPGDALAAAARKPVL